MIGGHAGRSLARVLAWDSEVDASTPITTMELLPVAPAAVEHALARNRTSERQISPAKNPRDPAKQPETG